MKFIIRQLSGLHKIDELTALFNQYMMFYDLPSDETGYKEFLTARLNNGEAIIFLALNEAGYPIGFVLNYNSFSSLSQGKILVLNDLFVLPPFRKNGVAQALISATFVFATACNAVRVDLSTEKSNKETQKLYAKLGFKKTLDYDFYSYTLSGKG